MNLQKKQKYFFGFFWFFGPTRINPRSYVSPFTMENPGLRSFYEKLFEKLFYLIVL